MPDSLYYLLREKTHTEQQNGNAHYQRETRTCLMGSRTTAEKAPLMGLLLGDGRAKSPWHCRGSTGNQGNLSVIWIRGLAIKICPLMSMYFLVCNA